MISLIETNKLGVTVYEGFDYTHIIIQTQTRENNRKISKRKIKEILQKKK